MRLLDAQDDLRVVADHGGLREAFKSLALYPTDIVLIDFPDTDDCRGIQTIRGVNDDIHVVVSGVSVTRDCILKCAAAGASEYVPSDAGDDEWIAAVRSAARREIHNPRIAGILNRHICRSANGVVAVTGSEKKSSWRVSERIEGSAVRAGLTPRERQIMSLIDQGLSNKAIAKKLDVSPSTVKAHVHAILSKYQVHRRSDAAALFRIQSQL